MTTISTSPPSSANPPGDLPAVRAVAQRLVRVRQRIENAGGDPERVRIIGVTKGFGPPVVGLARAAGLRDLGENYAAELVAKAASQGEGPGTSKSVAWHFLGAVQQNKVARLAPLVALWQSVAREVEGARIARQRAGRGSPRPGRDDRLARPQRLRAGCGGGVGGETPRARARRTRSHDRGGTGFDGRAGVLRERAALGRRPGVGGALDGNERGPGGCGGGRFDHGAHRASPLRRTCHIR